MQKNLKFDYFLLKPMQYAWISIEHERKEM